MITCVGENLTRCVAQVVDDDVTVVEKALDWTTANITSRAAFACGLIKSAAFYASTHSLPEALRYEARVQTLTMRTDDHRGAVRSFFNKQRPVYSGAAPTVPGGVLYRARL